MVIMLFFIVNKRRVFKISKKGYCFEYVLVILIDYFVGELKILSSEFNNLWFNVFFDNKNIISNLYGNII